MTHSKDEVSAQMSSNLNTISLIELFKKIPSIYLLLIPLGTVGALFMSWLMPFGPGINVDTLYYVTSARNLVAGIGMGRITGLGTYKPMTHYPPFYSLVLAFFELTGIDEIVTGRWISIFAFGLSIILVGLIVYHRTHSHFFSFFASLLILLSNPILRNFSWVLTEPLYIVLMLFSILYLIIYLENNRSSWLVIASIFTSFSLLTRYVGFSLVGTFFVILLLNRKLSIHKRIIDLVVFTSITAIPILAWITRNWLASGTMTNRILKWHPVSSENLLSLIKAVNSWGLVPQRLLLNTETFLSTGIILLLALASLIWLFFSRPRIGKAPQVEFVILLLSWAYTLLLTISLFFLDATTPLDNRILLPLYVLVILLVIVGCTLLWQQNRPLYRISVVFICLWLAYFTFTRVDGAIADLRADGQGYSTLRWQHSPTIDYLRQHDTSLIYTNDITAVYFLARKDSIGIPNAQSTISEIAQMQENLRTPNSFMVIFGPLTGEFASPNLLLQELVIHRKFQDGTIYQHP